MDKEGRHFEACCVLRVLSKRYLCVKSPMLSSLSVAIIQQAAVTPVLGGDVAVRNPGTYKLISGSFSGHSVTEPGSRACQAANGSHTFSFITLPPAPLPGSYHCLIFMRFLRFCVDNKGRSAVITPDTAATSPRDYSDLSAGHSGLSPHIGVGGSLSLEPLSLGGGRA